MLATTKQGRGTRLYTGRWFTIAGLFQNRYAAKRFRSGLTNPFLFFIFYEISHNGSLLFAKYNVTGEFLKFQWTSMTFFEKCYLLSTARRRRKLLNVDQNRSNSTFTSS